jgi:hypothetical protein
MASPPLTGVAKDVYPSLLGSLQYAAVCTRPDVTTALSILGSAHAFPPKSAHAFPTEANLHALKKVLRYLHGTLDLRVTLGGYGPQSPPHMLCRRRPGKRQHHSQVTFMLSLHSRTRTHQLQVQATDVRRPVNL